MKSIDDYHSFAGDYDAGDSDGGYDENGDGDDSPLILRCYRLPGTILDTHLLQELPFVHPFNCNCGFTYTNTNTTLPRAPL